MALAISTTKSEYVAAGRACQQALWMKQAIKDYDNHCEYILVLCDNKGAIDLSKNPVHHSRTKHIEIRYHSLRDNVQKGNILMEKIASKDNIADSLTKPLKRETFNYLRTKRPIRPYSLPLIRSQSSKQNLSSSPPRILCRVKMWELVLTSNVFVKIGSKGKIVGYMLHCIQSNTPFNFAYFMAKIMVGMRTNDRLIPYARLLTRLFEVAKEEHPHPDHFVTCKGVDPTFYTFNASTWNKLTVNKDTCIGAEEEISSDKVIENDVMDKLSFGDKMAYKSYLRSKRQHKESRTKMEIVKNFLKKWATTMSYKDI
ncbi:hypothetical protein Tco_0769965 [Tanacetum coccineum]|uniref:Copia protein n=1 Tax=Tanacetum coccineum TaxID=301880 RepID=A0ABQ4ZAV0_9ASTR